MMVWTSALGRRFASTGQTVWLYNRSWDLTFVILSAALVAAPLVLYYWLAVPTRAIDLIVAGIVGGPHMYATLTVTYLDPTFVRRHPAYAAAALLVPVAVVVLALLDLTLLLTVFMFWASIHVLHQLAYVADCYRRRAGEPLRSWSRAADYALIFSSLYPFATEKLVSDAFVIGGRALLVPAFVKGPWLAVLAWSFFAGAALLFILKTGHEIRKRRANWPRILLITVGCSLALLAPTFDNLDVAFQGMNVWHSFQYLAIIWYVNKLRSDNGELLNGTVRRISGNGRGVRFYFFNVGVTALAALAIGALFQLSGLGFEQAYYIVVLGSLLVHYYFDHFLFTRVHQVVRQ
ncbi:MAG: hypothetical protein HY331_13800 [Chloroflexi bacterium]|nr:hypothetical protein [Chloroflexota bacterium]